MEKKIKFLVFKNLPVVDTVFLIVILHIAQEC
jgi:hypothetical protein